MAKFSFVLGFGAGYVLGAKAGKQRYEQIKRLYDNVTSSPGFQRAAGKAREAVGTSLEQARDAASGGVSKVTGAVKEKRSGGPSGLSVAPPPGS